MCVSLSLHVFLRASLVVWLFCSGLPLGPPFPASLHVWERGGATREVRQVGTLMVDAAACLFCSEFACVCACIAIVVTLLGSAIGSTIPDIAARVVPEERGGKKWGAAGGYIGG